ncbi:MAG: hypothetical protein ABEJ59_00920 [Halanaeroarchaeum sp.]
MSLDVEPPERPDLTITAPDTEAVGDRPEAGRREEIEEMLEAGAWPAGFGEWSEHTDLTVEDWAIVTDLELVNEFDFWWNAEDERVRYDSPTIPDEWAEDPEYPELTSLVQISAINVALDELGQTVQDRLQQEYVDWNTEEPSDHPE